MKAAEDLKQKKINEQSNSNSGKQPSTWDRLVKPTTKPVQTVSQQLPSSKSNNPVSTIQVPAAKKGLIESIFGVKKPITSNGTGNVVQGPSPSEMKSSNEVQETLHEQVKISPPSQIIDNAKPIEVQKQQTIELAIAAKPQNIPPVEPLRTISVAEEVSDEYQIEDR